MSHPRTLDVPPEWVPDGAMPLDVFDPQVLVDETNGAEAVLTGVLLDDGTNVWILAWEGGQRSLRSYPEPIIERFDGRLFERHRAIVEKVWPWLVNDVAVKAGQESREEWATDPSGSRAEAQAERENLEARRRTKIADGSWVIERRDQ